MCSESKNVQLELNQMQQRIQYIKKQNEVLLKNSNRGKKINYEASNIYGARIMKLNQYTSRYEHAVVMNCYKKSLKLIKDRLNKKKEKINVINKKKFKIRHDNPITDRIKVHSGKSSISIGDKNNTEIVTLDDDSSESCNLKLRPSLKALSNCRKKIISNSFRKYNISENIENTDVVYLKTVSLYETLKSQGLNHKKKINHIISDSENLNKSSDFEIVDSIDTSVSSFKKGLCKSNKTKEKAKNSIHGPGKIMDIFSNNFKIIDDQNIIYLERVNNFSEFSNKNNNQSGSNMKKNVSNSKAKVEYFDLELDINSNENCKQSGCNVNKNASKGKAKVEYCNLELDINSSNPLVELENSSMQTSHSINFSTNSNDDSFLEQLDDAEDIPEWDFTEEPVDFPIPLLHSGESTRVSFEKLKELKLNGVEIKTGTWSKEEMAILRRNFKNFTAQFGITNVNLLLGNGRQVSSNKCELKNIKKFWKVKHFLVRLGKDLNNRILQSIYLKARYLFDPLNSSTKFSAEDIAVLLDLKTKYGNKWHLISNKLGRSITTCKRLYINNAKCTNKGKWSEKELKLLFDNVKKVTKADSFKNLKMMIPWNEISKYIPTRNSLQCCQKWYKLKRYSNYQK